jgi:hypothetical protein
MLKGNGVMKTASCKAKGRKHQQAAAKILIKYLELEEADIVSRSMGSAGEDLLMSPLARKKLPLSLECKSTKSFPSLAALEQARYNAKGNTPAVIWKPPGKSEDESIIYFNIHEFMKLWKNKNVSI